MSDHNPFTDLLGEYLHHLMHICMIHHAALAEIIKASPDVRTDAGAATFLEATECIAELVRLGTENVDAETLEQRIKAFKEAVKI